MTMQHAKQNGPVVGFFDNLNDAIRENPVAASLVGMGVLWMFFGNAKIGALGSTIPSTTNAIGHAATAAANAVGGAFAGTVAKASEGARQVSDEISSSGEAAAKRVLDQASAGYDAVKASGHAASDAIAHAAKDVRGATTEFGRHVGISMQQNLTRTLEAQPLLLGVIGVGIGAGIASMFSSTEMERDFMGEAGAAVKEKIHELTDEASDRAKEVFEDVKKEAAVQGLTASSASESLKGVVDKVRAVATASKDNIMDRLP